MKAVSIHLETLTERLPLITSLSEALQIPITIQSAVTDDETITKYMKFQHIHRGQVLKKGVISCTLTHIQALKEATSDIIIFEDDAELVATKAEFDLYINNAPQFDILCLGTSENVDFLPHQNKNIVQIVRFWGAHALLIKQRAIPLILATFQSYVNAGIFPPSDWLYSLSILKNRLMAYAPTQNLVDYKRGIMSSLKNEIRN